MCKDNAIGGETKENGVIKLLQMKTESMKNQPKARQSEHIKIAQTISQTAGK
jgi:hypothetical protein